jgi:hypothetical protein
MDFYKLIQSLDELVYEMLSWLLFYPMTLWRVATRPLRTMLSVERELSEEPQRQFDDIIGPPLFLALTLAAIHVVELQTVGQSELVLRKDGFAEFISNDINLLMLRIVMFGLLPLTIARRYLAIRREPLNKQALRAPFYAQCYAASFFAVLFNAGIFVASMAAIANKELWGFGLIVAAAIWLIAVEAAWFRHKLDFGWARALGNSVGALVVWLAVLVMIALIIN